MHARIAVFAAAFGAMVVTTAPGGAQPFHLPHQAARQLAPGKLLIAGDGLVDPNFKESVVLLIDYDQKGAFGLIVNRPTTTAIATILPDYKDRKGASQAVYFGGPVETPGVMALLRNATATAGATPVIGDVQLVSTPTLLDKSVSAGAGPDRFRVYVGYAGWAAGQLERETVLGSWHIMDGDANLVFDPEPDSLWRREAPRPGQRTASILPTPPGSALY